MKKVLFFVLALFACAGVFAQERIAVFPFEDLSDVFTLTESFMLYREFSNEFANKNSGRFDVLPRVDVEKLFSMEARFQLSNISERAKTAEVERALNGRQILSGVIGRVGNNIRLTVSLYTFPDFKQLPGGATLSVANKIELFDKIPELVQTMQNNIGEAGPRPSASTDRTYKVGDTGPAGGIVFYDKGNFSNGWRYLEAAPAETEYNGVEWGAYIMSGRRKNNYEGRDIPGTGTALGTGQRNTELIIEKLRQWKETGRAAQLCYELDFDGFYDWFLPSKDELNLMYRNLKQKRLGGFSGEVYWSSSQSDNDSVWSHRFSDGRQHNIWSKDTTYSVRAIRAF